MNEMGLGLGESDKIVKFIEGESRIMVARGWGEREMGRCWSKVTKFHLCKMNNSGDLMCSDVTIVNTVIFHTVSVLYTRNWLRG